MRALERGPPLAHALDHRERPRVDVSAAERPYARLIDQLLEAIERRHRDAQRRLEQLARQRAAMPQDGWSVANETVRAEAVAIRNELARLKLVASLTTKILEPLASKNESSGRRSPRRTPDRRARTGLPRGATGLSTGQKTDARSRASSGRDPARRGAR